MIPIGALTGCAGFAPRAPIDRAAPAAADALFQARISELSRQDRWLMSGRVAVSSETESWQATVNWRQSGEDFEVRIIGPLGQGAVRLRGANGEVTLELPDGEKIIDSSASALLARRLGWQLPVDALRYWLLGIPDAGSTPQVELAPGGEPLRLRQAGWVVDYKQYQMVDGRQLPSKIFLGHEQWRVKMVIDEWRLGTLSGARGTDASS